MFGLPGISRDIPVELLSQFCDLADRARESIDWFGHKVKVAIDSNIKWLLNDMQKHCPEDFNVLQDSVIAACNGFSILNSMYSENDSQVSFDSGVDVSSIKSSLSQESLNDLDNEEDGSVTSVSSVKSSVDHEGSDRLKSGQTPVLSESNLPSVCPPPVKRKQNSWDKFLARQDKVKQNQILHKAKYITRSEAEKQWKNGFRKTPSSTVKQEPLTKKQSEFVKKLSKKTDQNPSNEFLSHYDHYNRWKNSLGGDRAKSKQVLLPR